MYFSHLLINHPVLDSSRNHLSNKCHVYAGEKKDFFWVRTKISVQHIVWENLTKGHALTTTKSGWLTSVFTLMGPPRALESKPILELVLPRKSGDLGRIFVGGSRDFPESSASSIKKVAVFWDFLGNTKMGFNSIWLSKSLWIACVRVFKSHFFQNGSYDIFLLVKVFWTLYTPVCGEAHKQQRWCFW